MIRWRFVGVALVMGATLLGCSPDVGESTAPPSWTVEVTPPSPTPTRTWTVEQQAAIDAVDAFMSTWIRVAHDPAHEDIDSIREVARDPLAQTMLSTLTEWSDQGWHLVGDPSFVPSSAYDAVNDEDGVTWYVTGCYIVTESFLAGPDGAALPAEGRQERTVIREEVLETRDGHHYVSDSDTLGGSC